MWLADAFDGGPRLPGVDHFDPRFFDQHWLGTQTLPLGDGCNAPVILLDYEDYQWATRWLWSWTTSKQGTNRRHKVYARRNSGSNRMANGYRTPQRWLWLHKEICERAHGPPPTLFHTIADHLNGDTLNCRRVNLRWATPAENRANINGQAFFEA